MDDRNLSTRKATIFGHVATGTVCRVCDRNVDDGRAMYCSDYCREVAKAVATLYNWTPVRERVKKRDGYECMNCGTSRATLHVDHITPLKDGGHPFDPKNLQTLCEQCHQSKTAEENSKYVERPDIESVISEWVNNG